MQAPAGAGGSMVIGIFMVWVPLAVPDLGRWVDRIGELTGR